MRILKAIMAGLILSGMAVAGIVIATLLGYSISFALANPGYTDTQRLLYLWPLWVIQAVAIAAFTGMVALLEKLSQ